MLELEQLFLQRLQLLHRGERVCVVWELLLLFLFSVLGFWMC
jgi:hypothetical protein